MTTISEDTPTGGPEELQWKINALTDVHERVKEELERERSMRVRVDKSYLELKDAYENLTSRLTVGTLRKVGYIVEIEEAEFCEACGEEF